MAVSRMLGTFPATCLIPKRRNDLGVLIDPGPQSELCH